MPQTIYRHLSITGRVQGVSYRASAAVAARELGLRGWVRNRLDGSVEALVIGDAEGVANFISWARQGPPAARVAQVEVSEAAAADHADFELRPTC